MNGKDILYQLAQAYSHFESYSDTGSVTTVFHPNTEEQRERKFQFKTAFRRPSSFRFEWIEKDHRLISERKFVIWSDTKGAYSKYPWNESIEIARDLDQAIARATGISGRSAHTVPALLMDATTVEGKRITEPYEAELVREEVWQNNFCYRIKALFTWSDSTETWAEDILVGTDNYFLLGIESTGLVEQSDGESFQKFTKTVYGDVQHDVEIPEDSFRL